MGRNRIATWKFVGSFTSILYVILMVLAFLYNKTYVSDPYEWDFGGIIPLVMVNIPGLALYHFVTKIIGVGITSPTAWIVVIIVLNIFLYFTIGAFVGLLVEKVLSKINIRKENGEGG